MQREDVIKAREARKKTTISFKASATERAIIAQYCAENDITISDFIKNAVNEQLERAGYPTLDPD